MERPAGLGGYSWRWRGALALRARKPRRRRRSQREGVFRRPALSSAAGRLGLGEGDAAGAAAGGHPRPPPGAAVDTQPGGHQREAGTAGLSKGSAASAGGS